MAVQYVEDLENKKKVPWVLGRWPQTNQELWMFVKTVWGVEIPYRAVCPHHVSPFQAFADAYFARHPVAIWEGSRGYSGKTFTLGLLACTEMVTLKCFVTILGGSAEQSLRVHEAMQQFLDSDDTPSSIKNMVDVMTRYDTRLRNGAKARTLMASQKSVRGPHPQRLRCDEVDEMDWDLLMAAQGQPMRSKRLPTVDTQTIFSSTHQHADGTMTKLKETAKEKNFPIYKWCIGQYTLVLTSEGEKYVKDIIPGEFVSTRSGWRQVQHRTYMGLKPTIEVSLSNGRTLICTSDHKVLSDGNWVEVGSLVTGQSLTTVPEPFCGTRLTPTLSFVPRLDSVGAATFRAPLFTSVDAHGVIPTDHVGSVSGVVQVARPDTLSDTAQMVWARTRKSAVPQFEGYPVNKLCTVFTGCANTVSSAVAGFGPYPALSFVPAIGFVDSVEDVSFVDNDSVRFTFLPISTASAVAEFGPLRNRYTTNAAHSVHVVSIQDGADEHVYDIGVEGEHEFVAEGIVVHNCYKETSDIAHGGWLSPKEVERKRREIPKQMWEQEYDLLEPSFEGRAIDPDAVAKMFDPDLGTYKGIPMKNHEFTEPRNDRDYITGVDWASAQDWTVVWTWDTTTLPWTCVAFQRCQRLPWPMIVKFASMRLSRWGGKFIHDATGIGGVVKDMLDRPDGVSPRDVKDQILGGKERNAILSEYVAAIERGDLRCPRIVWAYDEHRFATNEHLYGRLHLPDSICAGALAWSMGKKGLRRSQIAAPDVSDGTKREGGVSPWKLV